MKNPNFENPKFDWSDFIFLHLTCKVFPNQLSQLKVNHLWKIKMFSLRKIVTENFTVNQNIQTFFLLCTIDTSIASMYNCEQMHVPTLKNGSSF